jgi:hypothetical protein
MAAKALALAVGDAAAMFHYGEEDRRRLAAVDAALADLVRAVGDLSHWAAQALPMQLQDALMRPWRATGHGHPGGFPADAVAVQRMAGVWTEAVEGVREAMRQGRTEGQTRWQSVALVGEAAQLWRGWGADGGRPLPQHELAEGHPFEAFLAELFGAFGLDASPRGQFRAWAKVQRQHT